jgi:glycerol-3-phosphate dehydrogenase
MVKRLKRIIAEYVDTSQFPINATVREDGVVILEGEAPDWKTADELAHRVAKSKKVRNVINHLSCDGKSLAYIPKIELIDQGRALGMLDEADVIIVGAGVIGSGIARELSKYNLDIVVLEKGDDVSQGASKANNGMIHSGNAVVPGTLKAKLNVEGNAMYSDWAADLRFEFKRIGSFGLSYNKKDRHTLWLSWIAGRLNKVPGMRFISPDTFLEMEKDVEVRPRRVLYAPTTAYVDGFEVTIALAENAAMNGVRFHLSTEVVDVDVEEGVVRGVVTDRGLVKGRLVINAAGVFADEIAAMAGDQFYTLHPRKGVIAIFDKEKKGPDRSLNGRPYVHQKNTKGGGVQRTVSGNPLWGPNAVEIPDKTDLSVQPEDLDYVMGSGSVVCPGTKRSEIIASFAGIRPADYKEDFIIERSRVVRGFIHVAGIQSPGLAAAPAIAKMVEELTADELGKLSRRGDWNPIREKPVVFSKLSPEEQERLISENPLYGHIVCRCETISEGEIVDAIRRPIPAVTFDAIKRRVRATAGRCQGGFCGPRILEIIMRETGLRPEEVRKQGKDSYIVAGTIRDRCDEADSCETRASAGVSEGIAQETGAHHENA